MPPPKLSDLTLRVCRCAAILPCICMWLRLDPTDRSVSFSPYLFTQLPVPIFRNVLYPRARSTADDGLLLRPFFFFFLVVLSKLRLRARRKFEFERRESTDTSVSYGRAERGSLIVDVLRSWIRLGSRHPRRGHRRNERCSPLLFLSIPPPPPSDLVDSVGICSVVCI